MMEIKVKKFIASVSLFALICLALPTSAAAAGISVAGGGTKYAGDTATVTITASGASFDSFSGTISASGNVRVSSCTFADALWAPSKPSCTGSFNGGLTSGPTSSLRIATLKVSMSAVGSGTIAVSNVLLVRNGSDVGSTSGSTSFTIQRRPTPPGAITITSTTHPDQTVAYEETGVTLNWERASGVTGFSYVFDQVADTVPPATATSNETTVSYADQAIGVYYFHLRALNGDGWGDASHFKVTIKEPDPRVKDGLAAPHDIVVKRAAAFSNDPLKGLFTGVIISGITEPNFTANIKLDPPPVLPENKLFSVAADATGHFEYTIDFPIKAGFYSLTTQGQDNKTLTPISDPILFEISPRLGGNVYIITAADTNVPAVPVPKWWEKVAWMWVAAALSLLVLVFVTILTVIMVKNKKLARDFKKSLKIGQSSQN